MKKCYGCDGNYQDLKDGLCKSCSDNGLKFTGVCKGCKKISMNLKKGMCYGCRQESKHEV